MYTYVQYICSIDHIDEEQTVSVKEWHLDQICDHYVTIYGHYDYAPCPKP